MVPIIRSYSPTVAISWFKQGIALYKKQFIRLSLVFIVASMLMSMATVLPIIGLLLALVSVPLSQMLLFNAAYGIRLRGHFLMSDLRQKLHTSKIWSRLLFAAFINVAIVYMILSITMPSLPLSPEAFLNLSSEEMQKIVAQTYTLSSLATPFFCICVYLLLSFWVYPLICWEDSPVIRAFIQSFKASMSNALALSLLIGFFVGLSIIAIFATQTIFAALLPSAFMTAALFVINTIIVALYICLFVAYMEIFYGKE